ANANEGLWPGQFVKAEIILGVEPNALAVPAASVQLSPQGPYVFVVKDGNTAELRPVVVSRTQNGESVIASGLRAGEQVVVDGQLRLVNGAAVAVRPPAAHAPQPPTPPPGDGGGPLLPSPRVRPPVMAILVMASFVIAGIFGYKQLPVAAVPRVDFPTIQVTAQLPGASPETMAASVASILERQFSTIAGVTAMTSTSSLGNTSIGLQVDLNRNIDGAALDVQSAICTALRRLPAELPTPPSFRKVNPADFPVMFMALKSSQVRLSDVDAFANRSILPRISTLPGVAQVLIFGSQKYAVRVRANLD